MTEGTGIVTTGGDEGIDSMDMSDTLGLCDCAEARAEDKMVRALMLPVLMGLDRAALEHSPMVQSDAATVTVTSSVVNTGINAPFDVT